MSDSEYGSRNARGEYLPNQHAGIAPVFILPPRPMKFLLWLPQYFLPWNSVIFSIAIVFWVWLTPSWETLRMLDAGWISLVFLRNAAFVFLFYGVFELRLYLKRRQGTDFKYNPNFPADRAKKAFWFGDQSKDGMLRTFMSALPIWTAFEVMTLWAFANDYVPKANWQDDWYWLLAIGLILPIIHEFFFFVGHRLLHTPFLYKHVHSVHHNAVNPSPWSSLAMHPIEHLVYFSTILLHLVIFSHPLLAMYQICYAGFGAIVGHMGFDKIVVGKEKTIDTHAYAHYLHHKYFEVNYGDGLVPLDKVFGTWLDGSAESLEAMKEKRRAQSAN